jgi:hypothetical protein
VAGYEKANSPGAGAWSQAVLARNLLGAGNLAEARNAAAKAIALSQKASGQSFRYEATLADARVEAKLGKTADALKELDATLASARKFGYRLYEYQTRLAMGEIELGTRSDPARAHLTALEKDARTHGAILVADQARALLSSSAASSKSH